MNSTKNVNSIDQRIGFIGAGNMAEAMIGSITESRPALSENIYISDIDSNRMKHLSNVYSIQTATDNKEIVNNCSVIIFAVKPQHIHSVLADLSERNGFLTPDSMKTFISIAAGIRIETFEQVIYQHKEEAECRLLPIIRVMPNTPALVRAGMTAVCCNKFTGTKNLERARELFSAMGKVMVIDEDKMDAVTALSGSGPAYCYYFIESMISAGVQMGFSPEDSAELSISTFSGALRLLETSAGETAESLRRKVTSPGGTTEAALAALDRNEVKKGFISAIFAAAERSLQLSGKK